MNQQITDRGTLYSMTIGDLEVSYLSGKDAGPSDPVYAMSLGEVALANRGSHAINLKYNATQTFFTAHRFEVGDAARDLLVPPPSPSDEPASFINYDLPPGQRILISRQDFMEWYYRVGRAGLADGAIATRYEAALQVDDKTHPLIFGPHGFQIALDRDWAGEEAEYLKFFAARDKGQAP